MRLLKTKQLIEMYKNKFNKEEVHWKRILLRIIDVVKNLGKNNLAFRWQNEKIYQEIKTIKFFLSLIEIIA